MMMLQRPRLNRLFDMPTDAPFVRSALRLPDVTARNNMPVREMAQPPQPFDMPPDTGQPLPPFGSGKGVGRLPPPQGDGTPPPPTTDPTDTRPPGKDKPQEWRPPQRTYWNPSAASFGEYDSIWQSLPAEWKAELSGFPQDGVRDYLSLLKFAQDNQAKFGKNGLIRVDNQYMDPIDAARYVLGKMREVAQQMDTNTRQYKDQQAADAKQKEYDRNHTPLPGRMQPIFY